MRIGAENMSDQTLKTRSKQGSVLVTSRTLTVKLLGQGETTITRDAITGIETKTVVPSILGMGGGADVTFHLNSGKLLKLEMVPPKDASQIKTLLGF